MLKAEPEEETRQVILSWEIQGSGRLTKAHNHSSVTEAGILGMKSTVPHIRIEQPTYLFSMT